MNKKKWAKVDKKKWARVRFGVYALGSAVLKYAGIKGWVESDESQALLLILSAVLDLALFNVDLSDESIGDTPEELDAGRLPGDEL